MRHFFASRKHRTGSILCMFALALCLLFSVPVCADDGYKVSAHLEAPGGATDTQPVRFVITIEGDVEPQIKLGRFPAMKNLKVLNGPNTSKRFRQVNAVTSTTIILEYVLLAEGPGEAEIPPIELTVAGEVHHTDPVRFQVAKGTSSTPRGTLRKERERSGGGAGDDVDVYIRARLSDSEVYVGQAVALSLTLYSALNVTGLDWIDRPAFSKFWVENDHVDIDAERRVRQIGDRRYAVYPLERSILIPNGEGRFEIDPYTLHIQVSRSTGNIFDDFFSRGRSSRVVRKSEPLELTVKPLPASGRPDSFKGAVGAFTVEAVLDRTEAAVDEAVALKVKVRGNGFLKSAPAPEIQAPPDLKLFEPKVEERQSTAGGRLETVKTWEWIMVPLTAGELRLPEIRFSWFDPDKGRYMEHVEGDLLVNVIKGEGIPDRQASGGRLRLQRRDIAFIKARRGDLAESAMRTHQSAVYRTLFVLPFILFPLAIMASRWYARMQEDQGLVRSRKARNRAARRLASVARKHDNQDSATYHEEIARALVEYVADRFDRSPAGLTYDLADDLLASRSVPIDLRQRFRACLEACDFARFVPSSGSSERRAEILESSVKLVEDLEKAF